MHKQTKQQESLERLLHPDGVIPEKKGVSPLLEEIRTNPRIDSLDDLMEQIQDRKKVSDTALKQDQKESPSTQNGQTDRAGKQNSPAESSGPDLNQKQNAELNSSAILSQTGHPDEKTESENLSEKTEQSSPQEAVRDQNPDQMSEIDRRKEQAMNPNAEDFDDQQPDTAFFKYVDDGDDLNRNEGVSAQVRPAAKKENAALENSPTDEARIPQPNNKEKNSGPLAKTVVRDTEEMLDLDYTIAVVMATGVMFLEAGAEVYRAEATMNRLGKSIPGVEDCISYVTVTGIMCSMVAHGQTVTRIARVGGTNRNLSVINAINQLSRNAELYHFSPVQIQNILDKIVKLPTYSARTTAVFGALGALGFAIFFDGTLTEIIAVFVIGLLIQIISGWMSRYEINQIFVNGLAAFGAALASEWVHMLFPLAKVDVMIISSIMLLVPGLTMTNAIRDTVMGEYLSGVARGAEALIIATSIAIGVALALAFFM